MVVVAATDTNMRWLAYVANIFAFCSVLLSLCICPSLVFLWGKCCFRGWLRCVLCCHYAASAEARHGGLRLAGNG